MCNCYRHLKWLCKILQYRVASVQISLQKRRRSNKSAVNSRGFYVINSNIYNFIYIAQLDTILLNKLYNFIYIYIVLSSSLTLLIPSNTSVTSSSQLLISASVVSIIPFFQSHSHALKYSISPSSRYTPLAVCQNCSQANQL